MLLRAQVPQSSHPYTNFLPLYKKGTELVWTKIFHDDKYIIGKIRGPERQDSDLNSTI